MRGREKRETETYRAREDSDREKSSGRQKETERLSERLREVRETETNRLTERLRQKSEEREKKDRWRQIE